MHSISRGIMFCALAVAPFIAGAGGLAYGPNTSFYLSYSFDAPPEYRDGAAFHYGFRLDHDWRLERMPGQRPALFEWQFDLSGFDHIAVSGLPLVSSEMVLQAEGDGGLGAYIVENIGTIIIIGGSSLLVGLMAYSAAEENSRDTSDISTDGSIDCTTFPPGPSCTVADESLEQPL